ncbi:MAG: SH3 domain-containing protein [Clostridia bacterium]|nr:SH3 domain-containing protein [Clostridia bacterium]
MKTTSRWIRALVCLVLALTLCATAVAPAMAVGQSSTLATSGGTYYVNCSGLNLRSGASMGNNIIGVLGRGTKVTYSSSKNGWWYVSTPKGYGYVDKQYLAPSTQSSSGTYYVTATTLNIRSKPNTGSSIVGHLSHGSSVSVTKLNGDWGQISSGGWVALRYLSKSSQGKVTIKSGSTYRVKASALNVRASASTSGGKLDIISRNTSVYVQKTSGGWAYVRYTKSGKTKYGWVSSSYLG